MKSLLFILLACVTLKAGSLDSELRIYLQQKLAAYEKFEYKIMQLPQNYARIEINKDKSIKVVKNYAYVPVNVFNLKNKPSAAIITLQIKLFKNAFVVVNKILKNEPLHSELFEQRLEDVALMADKIVEPEMLKNKRSKTLLNTGEVLTIDMLEEIPAVNKGEKVIVHAGSNGVNISIEAITRQDGLVGEVIAVQASNKVFKAKVMDQFNLRLVE